VTFTAWVPRWNLTPAPRYSLTRHKNLQGRDIAVLVLCAKSNDISDLIPLVPAALAAMPLLQKGQLRKTPAS
jgi:hypothetical protein